MLTFIRRSRYLLLRLGLGLVVLASLAAVVVIAYGLPARAPIEVHDDYDPVTLTSDSSDSTSVERARKQIASLIRADDAVDWSGLTFDMTLTGPTILPSTNLAELQLEFIGDAYPSATNWQSSATHARQGAPADAMSHTAFAGSTLGGGGIGGVGGGGGGGSIGAAGGPGSDSRRSLAASNIGLPTLTALFEPQGAPGQPSSNGESSGSSFHASDSNGSEKPNGRAGGSSVAALAEGEGADVVAVPEPSTLMLAAAGLISVIASRSRRRASC
jgi:PEP-CTERM motif